jgi:hypothetical protein
MPTTAQALFGSLLCRTATADNTTGGEARPSRNRRRFWTIPMSFLTANCMTANRAVEVT